MQQQGSRKTALVTGASSGIGRCIAVECARRGMQVVVVGRNKASLTALSAAVGLKTPVAHVVVDLLDQDAARQVLEALRTNQIGVDLLVNCAGQGMLGPFAGTPLDAQRAMLRLNFEVPLELTHALLPQLQSRRGAVLNIGRSQFRTATPQGREFIGLTRGLLIAQCHQA